MKQFFYIQVLPLPFPLRQEILILGQALAGRHHAIQIDDVPVHPVVPPGTETEYLAIELGI